MPVWIPWGSVRVIHDIADIRTSEDGVVPCCRRSVNTDGLPEKGSRTTKYGDIEGNAPRIHTLYYGYVFISSREIGSRSSLKCRPSVGLERVRSAQVS